MVIHVPVSRRFRVVQDVRPEVFDAMVDGLMRSLLDRGCSDVAVSGDLGALLIDIEFGIDIDVELGVG